MPQHWTGTVLVSVITTLLTLLLAEIALKPRLEARNRRIQAAHIARDKLSDTLLTIFNCCAITKAYEPATIGPLTAAETRYEGDHQRALTRLDEATRYLIDNVHSFALGYVGLMGFRDQLLAYAAVTRAVYLSERTEQQRIEIIEKLSLLVQGIYFTRRLSRETRHLSDRRIELNTLLDGLASDPNFTLPPVLPTPAPSGAVGAGE